MKKINLLVFGRFPTEKAYGIHAFNQAKSFSEIGYDVEIFYPSTSNAKTLNIEPSKFYGYLDNVKFTKINNKDLTGKTFFKYLPNIIKKILWIISGYVWSKNKIPNIKNQIFWSTNPVILFPFRLSNKIIFEQHGRAKYLQKLFIKLISNENAYFVGTTQYSFKKLKKINPKSIYLPNGVDLEKFKITQNQKRETITVGYAGMLETYDTDKGVLNSVRAMLDLMDELNFKVKIIGGPEHKLAEIRNLVKDNLYENNFQILGWVDQDKLASEVQNFDIGIVPYPDNLHMNLYASPLKIFEYLATGLVCLVSDLESHKELEHLNLVYFKNEDFLDFKKQLQKLISNKEYFEDIKEKVLNQRTKISIEKRNKKLLDFMRL